jgi:hypothetical protein
MIKLDLKLPSNCMECPFMGCKYGHNGCDLLDMPVDGFDDARHPQCPIIDIPNTVDVRIRNTAYCLVRNCSELAVGQIFTMEDDDLIDHNTFDMLFEYIWKTSQVAPAHKRSISEIETELKEVLEQGRADSALFYPGKKKE